MPMNYQLKKQLLDNYETDTPSWFCNCVPVPACFVIALVVLVWVSVYLSVSVYVQDLRCSKAMKEKKKPHGESYIIREAWHSFLHSANAGLWVVSIDTINCNETNFIMTPGVFSWLIGWFGLWSWGSWFVFWRWGLWWFSFSKKNTGSDILTATIWKPNLVF